MQHVVFSSGSPIVQFASKRNLHVSSPKLFVQGIKHKCDHCCFCMCPHFECTLPQSLKNPIAVIHQKSFRISTNCHRFSIPLPEKFCCLFVKLYENKHLSVCSPVPNLRPHQLQSLPCIHEREKKNAVAQMTQFLFQGIPFDSENKKKPRTEIPCQGLH